MPDETDGNRPDPDGMGLTQEVGKSRIHEPSALERLVAARQAEKRAQRKRDSRVLVSLAVAAVVLVGGGVFAFVRFAPSSWLHRSPSRAAAPVRPTPTLSRATPFSRPALNAPPADPFIDTPANGWADGAAGIAIPAARAHGPYTTAQVRSAYETTRKLLIAGNLDWPTLHGGSPTAFTNLLTKQEQAQFLGGLNTRALDKHGTEKNTRTWISSFAPGSTQFVTTVIKVHGNMSAASAIVSGTPVLRVTFDYLFVFAVEPPGDPADWMRIVQQRYGTVEFAQWDDPGGPLEAWISVGGQTAGGQCGVRDGYIHPQFPNGPPQSIQPSGTPQDPYSLATPSAGAFGCRSVTGT